LWLLCAFASIVICDIILFCACPFSNATREVTMSSEQMRGERLQIMLSPEELATLDDFRFAHRMPSRAAAVRELLRRGLAGSANIAAGRARSRDFGIVDAGHT